jgi:hypothetical protein
MIDWGAQILYRPGQILYRTSDLSAYHHVFALVQRSAL